MRGEVYFRRYWAVLVIAVTLGIGVLIGTVISHGVRAARVLPAAPDAKLLVDPSPVALSNSFAGIASKVGPAVVNIRTTSAVRFPSNESNGPGAGSGGGYLHHFFEFGPGGVPQGLKQQSLGSGVILDKHGYVLTNYHVIVQDDGDPVDSIQVYLQKQDELREGYRARIIGDDPWTDLAVIKIDAGRPLPTAELGRSDGMRVGDWVLAIGSPFGMRNTVTAGIISAKGRDIEPGIPGEFKHFLQTDAAINPGNSGGPLVNLAGQVIGINTAIATTRDMYQGVGFAIPSDLARRIYNDIITTGSVRRGAIGVTFVNETNDSLLRSFGAHYGVVIESVGQGSPADRAGLKLGDVITAIDSKPVRSGNELLDTISNTAPGTKVRIDFLRDRRPMSTDVVVGDWNKVEAVVTGEAPVVKPQDRPSRTSGNSLGLSVKSLPENVGQEVSKDLRLPHPEGVVVEDVTPGGFADGLLIRPFDVILSIDHIDLHSVDDFRRVQSMLKPGQDVLFLIARRAGPSYVSLFLADRLP